LNEIEVDKVTRKAGKGFFIALLAGLITLLHFIVLVNYSPLIVLEELYYIPLLLGALWFGLRGALLYTFLFPCFISLSFSVIGPVLLWPWRKGCFI
jgi:hypothetical protein